MKSLKSFFGAKPSAAPAKKVGICLSGGGALGFAHIGVLQALEEHRIFPEIISGTSMGSIIGVFYAAGYTPEQMLQYIREGKLYKITKLMHFQPAFWKAGFSNHTTLLDLVKEMIPNNDFEKLEKPMHVCVSNLSAGRWEIINSGENLNAWIAASCSIPGVFSAAKINGTMYVDGGLLNNVPAQPLAEHCGVIIGSDVLPLLSTRKPLKPRDTLVASIRTSQHHNALPGRALCDFLIEPNGIESHHEFSYDAYQAIYRAGYRTAMQYIANHPEILKWQQKTAR